MISLWIRPMCSIKVPSLGELPLLDCRGQWWPTIGDYCSSGLDSKMQRQLLMNKYAKLRGK